MRIHASVVLRQLAALETDDCVVWPGPLNRYGHAPIRFKGRMTLAHRVALALRFPPPFENAQAAHGPCHNPACLNYRHLSWKTNKQNAEDRYRDGTDARGEHNPSARLRRDQVLLLRELLSAGCSQAELGRRFEVNAATIRAIEQRRTWGWLQ